jgi:hypothetical protein
MHKTACFLLPIVQAYTKKTYVAGAITQCGSGNSGHAVLSLYLYNISREIQEMLNEAKARVHFPSIRLIFPTV